MNLVIKGAYYFDGAEICVPHFTGECVIVDATRYMKKSDLLSIYDKKWYKENKDNYVEYQGEKYFYGEYTQYNTSTLSLLSDLSELLFLEEDFNF